MRISLFIVLLLAGCRTGRNYDDPAGPRSAGVPRVERIIHKHPDTLLFVSFNIEFARRVDSAIAVLTLSSELRDADVVALQEMDEQGTRRIADSLGMWYVYYPAIYHRKARRDFGNAVLSRWPIVEDAKILLPHRSRYARTQRTATAATIRVGSTTVRVYSTHLGTVADIRDVHRADQVKAIIDDAKRYERVVIAGDMNDFDVGHVARQLGYAWPTEHGPRTTSLGRWDHIFIKGLQLPDSASAGTVIDVRRTSDHRPVWARAILR